MAKTGRGWLNSLEQMPEECQPIIEWANIELNKSTRTQTDIYSEFVSRLEALQKEYRGELEFSIPSFASFNRNSLKKASLAAGLNETRKIIQALKPFYDADASDDLTIIASEAIKSLVLELYSARKSSGITPKDAMALANALRSAAQAQEISTSRRQAIQKEFGEKVVEAVSMVAKAKGLSADTAEEIKSKILGIAA